MSTFSIETNRNHALIPTQHLNDTNLSLKAKGLLTQLLTHPTEWGGTLAGLTKLSNDTEYSVKKALAELENEGYIYRHRYRKTNGQFAKVNYTLYLHPTNLADNPIYHSTHQPEYNR